MSDLLKEQQANLTHQENILEGQMLAQKQGEKACHEQQRELKETVETLAQKLEEKSQKQAELYQQNLNLQEVLKKAANFSGMSKNRYWKLILTGFFFFEKPLGTKLVY